MQKENRIDSENFTLCNDVLFKKFFTMPEAHNIIIRFLSAIINLPKEDFKNAVIISEEMTSDMIDEKIKTTDNIIVIDDNKRIVVEMNSKITEYYHEKIIIAVNIDEFNNFNTEYPILRFKSRDEYGHIENNLYSSIHLILPNIGKNEHSVDKEIEKFSNLLKEKSLSRLKEINKDDDDYMTGIEKLEDMIKYNIDE